LSKLTWAFDEAERLGIENMTATCNLMLQLGEPIFFSRGSEENLKITTVEDLKIFKSLLHTEQDKWLK
jgi:2-C-methyl-D-erythritol 4-phosphate cytidylyltransferase